MRSCTSGLRAISRTSTRTTSGSCSQRAEQDRGDVAQLLARGLVALLDRVRSARAARPSSRGRSSRAPRPSTRSSGRAGRARRPPPRRCRRRATCGSPCARRRERQRRGSDAASPPHRSIARSRPSQGSGSFARMQALGGMLVVDLTRYLPGAFASSELLRLGARVVRIEQPGGDPMRATAPEWHDVLNAGKESVVCDLPAEARVRAGAARPRGRRARVVPARRRGAARRRPRRRARARRLLLDHRLRPRRAPRAARRPRPQLSRLGGRARATRRRRCRRCQVADLAAGALGAVTEILAALLARERTGEGAHIVVSMTHGSHALAPRAPRAHAAASRATRSTRARTAAG